MPNHIRTSLLAAWAIVACGACQSDPIVADGEPSNVDASADASADPGTGPVSPATDAGIAEEAPDGGSSPGEPSPPPDPDETPPVDEPDPTRGVRVVGNQLVKDGVPFQIRGVNRSGTEYSCVQRGELFDGPSDDASLAAIREWGANAVRIPLNETCWLGINGVPEAASGEVYQEAILSYVRRIEAHGMTPILDLHWAAPGDQWATEQLPMPNRDHTPEFWRQVATAVKDDPYVVLELFNEPWPDHNQETDEAWRCWRDGGHCPGFPYEAAGMQELLDAVRSTGAENVVLAGGIRFTNSLAQWLAHKPHDPLGQLAAAWHVYPDGFCVDTACFDRTLAPVAAEVPLVTTEMGEGDCAGGFITHVMDWLDAHDSSYLAWVWNTWTGCMVLIEDYDGTPGGGGYGATYRERLRSHAD